MQSLKKIIVTGSNKGIGKAIVQNLAKKNKYHIIMACRNYQLAQKTKNIIIQKTPQAIIDIVEVDISDYASVEQAAKTVKSKFGKIDILLNNAGVAHKTSQINNQIVETTFKTNFYGTVKMCQVFLPLIQNKGKIINVASSLGTYIFTLSTQQLKNKFDNPNITKQQLFALMNKFSSDVKLKSYTKRGWKNNGYFLQSVYAVSKLGVNIYTRILAKVKQVQDRQIQIYSLCPGYVKTDMTSHKGELTVEQGALTPVYLVQLQHKMNEKIQGKFIYKCEVSNL